MYINELLFFLGVVDAVMGAPWAFVNCDVEGVVSGAVGVDAGVEGLDVVAAGVEGVLVFVGVAGEEDCPVGVGVGLLAAGAGDVGAGAGA